eukprot:CAMPEP_0182468180 /NCGR_PEP_ID=MMETSP1319-20130603/15087_1 /TAXON_ID=172717 /ORGANISM="Bolidomonas pacifica, Strain RCC208" /LENGTH=84 /DNA_ID=CAMNT_0024668349 /DNA_START=199 /DNA_END=450 /DNA_ORIENTATION=-
MTSWLVWTRSVLSQMGQSTPSYSIPHPSPRASTYSYSAATKPSSYSLSTISSSRRSSSSISMSSCWYSPSVTVSKASPHSSSSH